MYYATEKRTREVCAMLRRRPRDCYYQHIADKTGLSMGFIKQFARGCFVKSRSDYVEKLAAFLDEVREAA